MLHYTFKNTAYFLQIDYLLHLKAKIKSHFLTIKKRLFTLQTINE